MLKISAILPWALVVLGVYAAYCGLLFLFQRSLVFPLARGGIRPSPQEEYPTREVIWLKTSFGRVESWYFPARARGGDPGPGSDGVTRPGPAVVIAHGNAELIDYLPPDFLRFADLGLAVLMVEYPGYGDSEGSPSQETVTETIVTAYDMLAARPEIDPDRIIAFGRSLGGAAVCALASERPVAALILLSAFTSLPDMSGRYLAPGFLVRDRFDNLRVLRSYPRPVLILHGTADGLIPYGHGEELASETRQGRLISYPCAHNDCPADWEQFWEDVQSFLQDVGVEAG